MAFFLDIFGIISVMVKTIAATDPTVIDQAAKILAAGGLVLCPTETVYGAMVDATNPRAVAKLLRYKSRPHQKPISIACANQQMAEQYVILNEQAQHIYQTMLPGPVTVISKSCHQVAPGLTSEFDTLGVRIPAYQLLLDIVTKLGRPVTATSANRSGQKIPYQLADVFDRLSARQLQLIDLAIDAGQLSKNPPSLVLDTTTSTPMIVRARDHNQKNQRATPYLSTSDEETRALAGKIINQFWSTISQRGLVIGLTGDLGAGKTTFTQGIGNFLNIDQILSSPTYSYQKEYQYTKFDQKGTLHHLDVWTIDQPELLKSLELDQLQQPGNLVVIEWFNQVADFFTPTVPLLLVELTTSDTQENCRTITVQSGTEHD